MDAKYDIFRKLPGGEALWLKAVTGLGQAKSEMAQIAKLSPGEYFIFDTRNGSVVSTERHSLASPTPQFGIESTF